MAEKPLSNARITLITAVLSSLTTILVSFIGIVPQLRKADTDRNRELASILEEFGYTVDERMEISGTVACDDGTPFLGEIFLMPEHGTITDYTDDNGGFHFDDIPSQPYSILVRKGDPAAKGESKKILVMNPGSADAAIDTTIQVRDASITYTVRSY